MGAVFVKHLAVSLLGGTTSRAIAFLTLLFATRYYNRNDLGGLALAIGFVALVQPLLTLRYEVAVVLTFRDRCARNILRGLLMIASLGYIGLVILVIGLPNLVLQGVANDVMTEVRTPVLLQVAALTLNVACSAWLQRKKRFDLIAWTQVAGSVTVACWVIAAAFLASPSLAALVWAQAAGALVSTGFVLVGCVASGLFVSGRLGSVRRMRLLLKHYSVYPLYSLPLTLGHQASDRVRLIYISSAFSLSLLGGVFSIRQIILGMVFVITGSMAQVLFPHLCQGGGLLSSSRMLVTLTTGVAVMAGIALGVVCSYPREMTILMLGHRWLDIAPLLPWVAAQGAFLVVSGWQGRLLDVAGLQKVDAMLQMTGDVALVAVLAVLFIVSISPTAAIAIISTTEMAHSILWLVLAYRITRLGARYACTAFLALFLAAAMIWAVGILSRGTLGPTAGFSVCAAVAAISTMFVLLLTAKKIGAGGMVSALPEHRPRAA